MTLPIIVSLGSHLVFYLDISVNVDDPDQGSCQLFFSFLPSSSSSSLFLCQKGMKQYAVYASDCRLREERSDPVSLCPRVDNMIYPVFFSAALRCERRGCNSRVFR